MTWKYRYRREYLPDDALVAQCNALGEEGWSIVGPPRWVPPCVDDLGRQSAGIWCCFFKRTVSAREQLHALMRGETTPEQKAEIAAFRLSPGEEER